MLPGYWKVKKHYSIVLFDAHPHCDHHVDQIEEAGETRDLELEAELRQQVAISFCLVLTASILIIDCADTYQGVVPDFLSHKITIWTHMIATL